jgi:hypothetical protein
VEYEGEEHSQHLYRADKESPLNLITIYEPKPRSWLHERTKQVESIILVEYSSRLSHEEIKSICSEIIKDRIVNTLTNNCQEWVKIM